jgi:hypothetical protein
VAPDNRDGIHQGWQGVALPSRLSDWQGVLLRQPAGPPRDHRAQAPPDWWGAGHGPRVPLSRGLHAQVGTGLLPAALQTPPPHAPLQGLRGGHGQLRAAPCLGLELAGRSPPQPPAEGPRGPPGVRPGTAVAPRPSTACAAGLVPDGHVRTAPAPASTARPTRAWPRA